MAILTLNYPNIQDEKGGLHSIVDPTEYITFGPWIYLVPQYHPKSVLMLGYGGGTAAKLIRMFHGDVPITAVDFSDVSEFLIDGVEWIKENAKDYVKTAPKFDAVIVDLYDVEDIYLQDFVYTQEFADDLGKIANYIIIYATKGDDMSAYNQFDKIRELSLNTKGKYVPTFHYYIVNEIPRLPVR